MTVCLPNEPSSLFIYGDSSQSARSIREAIYDGPIDINNYEAVPVILDGLPTVENGGVRFDPITVNPGEQLVDSNGTPVNLVEGITYLPSNCPDFSCAVTYSGLDPIQVDQQVVRFSFKTGITWQDNEPLKASNSQYSYDLAKTLYPQARSDLLAHTYSYLAVDDQTIEWRGTPGYRYSGYSSAFFTPLPEHAWSTMTAQDLLTAEVSSRKPIGWGAFMIDEWISGDHISLNRNPEYFRQVEKLPRLDRLVFRFIENPEEALNAMLVGECDYLDESYNFDDMLNELRAAAESGKLNLLEKATPSWEHIDFGINSLSAAILPFVQSREVRQAVAYCSDRQRIVDQVFQGQSQVPDSYISSDHPLANPDVRRYVFEPAEGIKLLDTLGWVDLDGNPETPRTAQGVNGIPDGTLLELDFLLSDTPQNQLISSILKEILAQCGIGLKSRFLPSDQLFTAGEGAPIFGRNFILAQYGWMGSWQPACSLFSSQEIPGPYPQFPKGWGGANPSGYSSLDFDRACQRATSTLPEDPGYLSAHYLAQAIFADDLPSLPLFQYNKRIVIRTDLCGADLDGSEASTLWNIENFNYGENCSG